MSKTFGARSFAFPSFFFIQNVFLNAIYTTLSSHSLEKIRQPISKLQLMSIVRKMYKFIHLKNYYTHNQLVLDSKSILTIKLLHWDFKKITFPCQESR